MEECDWHVARIVVCDWCVVVYAAWRFVLECVREYSDCSDCLYELVGVSGVVGNRDYVCVAHEGWLWVPICSNVFFDGELCIACNVGVARTVNEWRGFGNVLCVLLERRLYGRLFGYDL